MCSPQANQPLCHTGSLVEQVSEMISQPTVCAPRIRVHVAIRREVHLVPHEEVVESCLELGGVAVLTLPNSQIVAQQCQHLDQTRHKALMHLPHNRLRVGKTSPRLSLTRLSALRQLRPLYVLELGGPRQEAANPRAMRLTVGA